jgi:hypothetical protein
MFMIKVQFRFEEFFAISWITKIFEKGLLRRKHSSGMWHRVDMVLTISTRRHIPEDCFLHSHRRENLKSYKTFYI